MTRKAREPFACLVGAGIALVLVLAAPPAKAQTEAAAPHYRPIRPSLEQQTITLTGHDLTIEQVVQVARHGAKVRFTPEALALGQARADLLVQGDAEGMAIYGINTGNGSEREDRVGREARLAVLRDRDVYGARAGALPEIDNEELVRAFLVIQANHQPFNSSTAAYAQAVIELLNRRVTPVMYARGTIGEGDLPVTSNFHATLTGHGDAYFQGRRMPAAEALALAGLKPWVGETGKATSNAYATALSALLVDEARHALEWSDISLTMDLLAMNSSITPMAPGVQSGRPFPWLKWEAEKQLALLRDSYLVQEDPTRALQDPESLRAAYIRLGSAWEAWADLRDTVLLQMNSREQNPSVVLDAGPEDHWVYATPWMRRYFVKGGPASKGRSGYILSTANWDPYPLANKVEAFSLAFANMAVTVTSRIDRYASPLFTGVAASQVLTPQQLALAPQDYGASFVYLDLWREIQALTQSIPPNATGADLGVGDLEAASRLKASRAREAVDIYLQLLSYNLLTSTHWLEIRKLQDPRRSLGASVTAALASFRRAVPFQQPMRDRPELPNAVVVYRYLKATPAGPFLTAAPPMPATLPLPVASD